MISKTIGYNGVHNIFRHTHFLIIFPPSKSTGNPSEDPAGGLRLHLARWPAGGHFLPQETETWEDRGDHLFRQPVGNVHCQQHHPSDDDDDHYKNYIKIILLLLLHIITSIDLIIEMMRTIVTVIMGLPFQIFREPVAPGVSSPRNWMGSNPCETRWSKGKVDKVWGCS